MQSPGYPDIPPHCGAILIVTVAESMGIKPDSIHVHHAVMIAEAVTSFLTPPTERGA
jgi:hypothetical protein